MPTLVKPSNQPNTLDIGPTGYRNNDANSSNLEANAICYVVGDLLKKCLSKHDCEIWRDRLVVNQLDNGRKMFCLFKACDTQKSEFGALLALSVPFFDFYTQIEDVLIAIFRNFAKASALENIFLASSMTCQLHLSKHPTSFQIYANVSRHYYHLKFANRESHSANERTENTSKFRTYKKINNKLWQKRSFNTTVATVNILENTKYY